MKIQAQSVSKVYVQGEKRIYALNDINIDIAEGKFTAIVGTSGCGKSTLLRTLSAIEAPTEGSVLYDHRDIYKLSDLEKIQNLRWGHLRRLWKTSMQLIGRF